MKKEKNISSDDMKHISLRIRADLLKEVDELADSYSITRNSFICYVLASQVKTQKSIANALSEDNIKSIVMGVAEKSMEEE